MKTVQSIWLKPQHSSFHSLSKDKLEIQSDLYRVTKQGIYKKRYFGFYQQTIRQYEDKNCTKIKKFLLLNFDISVEWLHVGSPPNPPFQGLILHSEGPTSIQVKLVSPNTTLLYKLHSFLKQRIFQCNIADYYKAIKKIGSGGYANVYILESKNGNGKQFAAKTFFKSKVNESSTGKTSLALELEILRKLPKQSGLLQLIETFHSSSSYYVITELLDSGTFLQHVRSQKLQNIPIEQQVLILSKLLESMVSMKKVGIMHRDLKPENIMFRDGLEPCIIDFGLADFWRKEKYLFSRCGTPGFVAPEVANSKDPDALYDAQCDVFGFGCLAHIMLVGRPVFQAKNYNEMLFSNKSCEINWAEKRYSKLSPWAMDFLQKILRKDPKQRITVEEALEHKFIVMHLPSENISSDAEDESNAIEAFMIKNHALEKEALHTKNLLQNTSTFSHCGKAHSNRQINFGSQMIEEPQSMILSRASMHQTKPFLPQSMQFSENQFGSYIFAQHPAFQQIRSGCDPSTYKSYEDATPGFPKAGDTFITVNEKSPNNKKQQQQLNESQFRQSQFYSSQLKEIEDEEEVLSFDDDEDKQQQQEESKLVYLIEKQKSSALNTGNTVQRFNESTQNFTRLTGTAQQTSDHKFQGNEEFSSKRKFK